MGLSLIFELCNQFCSSNPGPTSIKDIMEGELEDYLALDDGIIHVILNTFKVAILSNLPQSLSDYYFYRYQLRMILSRK